MRALVINSMSCPPRGRPEDMERGCANKIAKHVMNKQDAMDRGRQKKLIKIG